MSNTSTDTADNDDAQAPDHEDDGDEQQELDWDQASAGFAERQKERRELEVHLPQGVAVFVVRGLDDDEQSEVENGAVNVQRKKRRDPDIDLDSSKMRQLMLKYGIVSGPDGFKPHREDHVSRLPPGVKDQLAEEIEDLSSLDVVERDSFQEMGSR